MPNWCQNKLTIIAKNSKAGRKELSTFKKTASAQEIIESKCFDKKRKEWLRVHEKQYLSEKRVTEWVVHNTMPVEEFFLKILNGKKLDNGNIDLGDTDLSMNLIMPIPTELRNLSSPARPENGETNEEFKKRAERHESQYGHSDWYSWSVSNWGTKWDVIAQLISSNAEELVYEFDSAWSPPINFIATVSEKFPNLVFQLEYEEPGEAIKGISIAEDGMVNTEDLDYEYKEDDEIEE